jgi:hypothetical protein
MSNEAGGHRPTEAPRPEGSAGAPQPPNQASGGRRPSVEVAQVDGNHYAAPPGWGHWDVMEAHDIAYLEATATAYIRRWDLKGTKIKDAEKALSYLVKMGGRGARRVLPEATFNKYSNANGQDAEQRYIAWLVLVRGGTEEVAMAVDHLRGLIKWWKIQEKRAAAPY